MFKYKKYFLILSMFLIIILYLITFFKYMFTKSNIFGLYYLLIMLLIIFLIVPVTYNYKRHYSKNRISKLIIIVILGIFSSYLLQLIISNNIIDSSKDYIEKIFIEKNILLPIIYSALIIFILIETKIINKIKIFKIKKKNIF